MYNRNHETNHFADTPGSEESQAFFEAGQSGLIKTMMDAYNGEPTETEGAEAESSLN